MSHKATIAAIATAPGRAGIGIIRISGAKVTEVSKKIFGFLPKPRYAQYCHFKNNHGETLDQGILLFFPGPNSFTGEDILEFHGHGGPVIQDVLLQTILQYDVILAKPGEFSERAFLNNKIDLIQAEAIADLIDAGSQQAARAAIRSLQGDFSKRLNHLVERLVHLRMFIEAAIDFPEEEIEFLEKEKTTQKITELLTDLQEIKISAQQGSILREGITVVIAGAPNAGKSSLLNTLSGQELAIVTEIPGTTRDLLRERIQIDGIPLHIVDTAGLRHSADIIEQEGIKRAIKEIDKADIILWIIDVSAPKIDFNVPANIRKQKNLTMVFNKIDLLTEEPAMPEDFSNIQFVKLSAKTGEGLEALKIHLKKCVGYHDAAAGNFLARRRHLAFIENAEMSIQNGLQQIKTRSASELLAEDLRQAQRALGEITGEISSDDLLGKIFSSFCIGK